MQIANKHIKIMIAAGGTGGHLFPAISVADKIKERFPSSKIIMVVPKGRDWLLSYVEGREYHYIKIPMEGIKGRHPIVITEVFFKLLYSIMKILYILIRFRIQAVLAFGSYIAVPVGIAGFLYRLPIFIHEQNLIPGLANKILSYISTKIFVTFQDTKFHLPDKKKDHIVISGMPVRETIKKKIETMDIHPKDGQILVIGGSQGAHGLNRLIVDALPFLSPWREKIHWVHQTGKKDIQMMVDAYTRYGFSAKVKDFFRDMARQYLNAQIVISRAGASTLAELSLIGRPLILVPFPYAADKHQWENATYLKKERAAFVLQEGDTDGGKMAQSIIELLEDKTKREEMSSNLKRLGKADAASIMVNVMTEKILN